MEILKENERLKKKLLEIEKLLLEERRENALLKQENKKEITLDETNTNQNNKTQNSTNQNNINTVETKTQKTFIQLLDTKKTPISILNDILPQEDEKERKQRIQDHYTLSPEIESSLKVESPSHNYLDFYFNKEIIQKKEQKKSNFDMSNIEKKHLNQKFDMCNTEPSKPNLNLTFTTFNDSNIGENYLDTPPDLNPNNNSTDQQDYQSYTIQQDYPSYTIQQEEQIQSDPKTLENNRLNQNSLINTSENSINASENSINESSIFDLLNIKLESSSGEEMRDWNKEFQEVSAIADPNKRTKSLIGLERDFTSTAQLYAKVIISEYKLPIKSQTLSKASLGGLAGGDKFVVNNILFKFAVDAHNLYFGDHYAMKSASHEMKGLQNYYKCDLNEIHFPLMTIIDWRGWRITATSILPLEKGKSLIYGSDNAGKTVKNESKFFDERMRDAASILNLKVHTACGIQLATCFDIEGHKGKDGRFYILDFARAFPPEPPRFKGAHLYYLFRPEFVSSYKIPLCSDGFCRVIPKEEFDQYKEELIEAKQYLIEHVIPIFVFQTVDNLIGKKYLPGSLLTKMHEKGINYRFLGYVREAASRQLSQTTNDILDYKSKSVNLEFIIQDCLFLGMIRTVKNQLREIYRFITKLSTPRDFPYRETTAAYLNLLSLENYEKTKHWWDNWFLNDIEKWFPKLLTKSEKDSVSTLQNNILLNENNCLKVLSEIVPITFDQTKGSSIHQGDYFYTTDIIEFPAKVTRLNLINNAQTRSFYFTALASQNKDIKQKQLTKAQKLGTTNQKLEIKITSALFVIGPYSQYDDIVILREKYSEKLTFFYEVLIYTVFKWGDISSLKFPLQKEEIFFKELVPKFSPKIQLILKFLDSLDWKDAFASITNFLKSKETTDFFQNCQKIEQKLFMIEGFIRHFFSFRFFTDYSPNQSNSQESALDTFQPFFDIINSIVETKPEYSNIFRETFHFSSVNGSILSNLACIFSGLKIEKQALLSQVHFDYQTNLSEIYHVIISDEVALKILLENLISHIKISQLFLQTPIKIDPILEQISTINTFTTMLKLSNSDFSPKILQKVFPSLQVLMCTAPIPSKTLNEISLLNLNWLELCGLGNLNDIPELLKVISNFPSLRGLVLENIDLEDSFFIQFPNLKKIEFIKATSSHLTEASLNSLITNIKTLKHISFENMEIKDANTWALLFKSTISLFYKGNFGFFYQGGKFQHSMRGQTILNLNVRRSFIKWGTVTIYTQIQNSTINLEIQLEGEYYSHKVKILNIYYYLGVKSNLHINQKLILTWLRQGHYFFKSDFINIQSSLLFQRLAKVTFSPLKNPTLPVAHYGIPEKLFWLQPGDQLFDQAEIVIFLVIFYLLNQGLSAFYC